MNRTEFFKPVTLAEALDLLESCGEKSVIVNGGTDIVEKIAKGVVNPQTIIYIQDIPELKGIREEDGFIVIGGAVTYQEIEKSLICSKLSALIEAVSEIGSPAIRNMATPAGNIGTAMAAADCNVALLALDAKIILAGKNGEREMEISSIFRDKGQTNINENELIKEIRIPIPDADTCSSFVKLARRKAQDIAQVSVAVSIKVKEGICQDIKIALGAINPIPVRSATLEKQMIGKEVEKGLNEIKGIFPPEAMLRDDRFKPYKEQVTNVIIGRAISKAYEKAVGGECNG
jgi:CO/xanthine dehydrogenase FAD-binding subunit